jgi:hypothetical protein
MEQRIYQRKLDGKQEARLLASACSKPPAGKRQWALRLLAAQAVNRRSSIRSRA